MSHKNLLLIAISLVSINLFAMENPAQAEKQKWVSFSSGWECPTSTSTSDPYSDPYLTPAIRSRAAVVQNIANLVEAIRRGDLERAQELINQGVDPYAQDYNGFSAVDLVGTLSYELNNEAAIKAIPEMRELFGLNRDFNPAEEPSEE